MARPPAAAARGNGRAPATICRRPCSKAVKCRFFGGFPSAALAEPPGRSRFLVVNVGDLDKAFSEGATVDQESLRKIGLAKGPADGIRVLGTGELTKRLIVRAHHFSKSAAEKIASKGGTAERIPAPKKPLKNKMKARPPKEHG